MNPLAYLLVRLAIGTTIFGHGLVRLPKLEAFARGTVESFEQSVLPAAVVLPFGYFIVFAEFVTGLLLLIGLFTRQAAFAAGLLMVLLIAGTSLIENWGAIPSQLLHTAFLVVVLHWYPSNTFAVDKLLRK